MSLPTQTALRPAGSYDPHRSPWRTPHTTNNLQHLLVTEAIALMVTALLILASPSQAVWGVATWLLFTAVHAFVACRWYYALIITGGRVTALAALAELLLILSK